MLLLCSFFFSQRSRPVFLFHFLKDVSGRAPNHSGIPSGGSGRMATASKNQLLFKEASAGNVDEVARLLQAGAQPDAFQSAVWQTSVLFVVQLFADVARHRTSAQR